MYSMQNYFCISKDRSLKILCTETLCRGFQFLVILDIWSISFHVVVVFGLVKDLLCKYVQEGVEEVF